MKNRVGFVGIILSLLLALDVPVSAKELVLCGPGESPCMLNNPPNCIKTGSACPSGKLMLGVLDNQKAYVIEDNTIVHIQCSSAKMNLVQIPDSNNWHCVPSPEKSPK